MVSFTLWPLPQTRKPCVQWISGWLGYKFYLDTVVRIVTVPLAVGNRIP